jgi:hypothetical protein
MTLSAAQMVLQQLGVQPSDPAPVLRATVSFSVPVITTAVIPARSDLVVTAWGWEQLRDYVIAGIERTSGPFPRNFLTEPSIFKSFIGRYGVDAQEIARAAFEVHAGYWRGAPVSVTRFAKGNDPFFGDVIRDAILALR